MKILVVGYGLIGAQRVQALSKLSTVSEIVVVDPRLLGVKSLAPKVVSCDQQAAFSAKYDAAVVATPHDTAVELLPAIFPLAPHVLVEKPLGRTLVEADSLVSSATRSGTRIYVGLNYRFLKNVRHLHQLLSAGTYGKVLGVDAVLSHGARPGYEKSWKTDAIRCGGGVCIDPGIHFFDLFQWLFGGAELLAGHLSCQFWPIQVEDHASLILALPAGAVANLYLSLSSWQSRMEITVETEKAQIFLRGRGKFYGSQRLTIAAKWPWLQPGQPRETQFDYGMEDVSLQAETEEFLAACAGSVGNLTIAAAEDALRSMRIVDDCYTKLPKPY